MCIRDRFWIYILSIHIFAYKRRCEHQQLTKHSSLHSFGRTLRRPISILVSKRGVCSKKVSIKLPNAQRSLSVRKNVAIDYEMGQPKITKDGVTVAKNVMLSERVSEIGANLLRRVSHTTNMYAGDGTTTSTLLASEILNEGLRLVESGVDPMDMKFGIIYARDKVLEFLEEIAHPVSSREDKFNVAMVSTNYDKQLSGVVADAIHHVGIHGQIHIEPSNTFDTHLVFTEGAALNRGYQAEEFLTDKARVQVEMDYPFILIANQEIKTIRQIAPLLDKVKGKGKALFIIAKDISQDVLSNLIYNHTKGIIEVCAITTPGMGDFPKTTLSDMALLTGARLFDEMELDEIKKAELKDLGTAAKLFCSPVDTMIVGGGGDKQKIEAHLEELKSQVAHTSQRYGALQLLNVRCISESIRYLLQDRILRLSNKVALILVGGRSETEVGEVRDKVVDALNSVRAATETGILPGGGSAFIHASRLLDHVDLQNLDRNAGIQVLKLALRRPLERLVNNAGDHGRFIVETLLEKYVDNKTGYDLNQDKFVDMFQSGVVDSLKVIKTIIEDSTSIASMILTTECIIVKKYKYIPTPLKNYNFGPFQTLNYQWSSNQPYREFGII
eukprot:TRINITY_DN2028_c0_g2_i2.p1 TRINITY_DN2028_c0_g2~~TRINITY_DN2028_c0_g2_i2.p1  ORF type:complete len:652 (-),score=51.85 TRINITY_DN2028_c0_g2_i2:221-2062(-)